MAMTYGQGIGGASNSLQGAVNVARNQIATPTLSSAASKVDGINTRLDEAIKQLQAIHDQIGGPRLVSGASSATTDELPAGAVGRLNVAADRAHERLGELEGLISLVARALG